jgi:uncharacterized protein YyaL (SSP411 family)
VLRARSLDLLPANHPAFGKTTGAQGPTAYVCRRNVCGLPLTDGAMLAKALSARVS